MNAVQLKRASRGHRNRLMADILAGIDTGALVEGRKLPSVRVLARQHGVSPHTAAEVYQRLVAIGRVEARPGSGYFVRSAWVRNGPAETPAPADALWERRIEAPGDRIRVDAGGGWLPHDWQYREGMAAALRTVARSPTKTEGYGPPNGFEPLRAYFAQRLNDRGVRTQASDIVLTQGASQGLDLAVRALLNSGDTAVVEDPAYPPILELLHARGVRILSISRLETGPDVGALEQILATSKIQALYTNTTLQNPTGTSTHAAIAHRLADLAKAHDFTIIEDDIFADLSPTPIIPIAAFDNDGRVIHVSSLSKTIAPTLRVGYLLANAATLQSIMRLKILSALASSELSERIAYAALTQTRYRRHLRDVRERLGTSQARVQAVLLAHGVELSHRPVGGMFVWGRILSALPAGKIWQAGVDAGVLLAPGESFRADGRASPWWRFNVTQCEDHALSGFLSGEALRAD